MKAKTKRRAGTPAGKSGKAAARSATLRDLEVTDRDQEGTKGGARGNFRKGAGKNPW